MKKRLFLGAIGLFLLASAPRLLSLDAHWSSDETRWLNRSAKFISAVRDGAFSETLIAYHPGVTTMWIAGLRTFFTQPRVNIENLAYARWFIGLFVSACIVLAIFFVNQLFGRWVALACFACLAYSPLFLAQTRRVHTDALATTFILLTVLLFLLYCQNQDCWVYLIFSGIVFGFALLSKSYALIVLPWVLVCQFLFREKRPGSFFRHIGEFLCFLNSMILSVLALHPVFWTPFFGVMALFLFGITCLLLRSLRNQATSIGLLLISCMILAFVFRRVALTIWFVFDRVNWAVRTPHEVEHFFFGEVLNDPGFFFYPFILTIKSTPLMLPLSLIGCFLVWKHRKQTDETSHQYRMVVALVGCVLLFTLCLSATSKKFSRYLLPAFAFLEILSAIGFVEGLKWCYTVIISRFGRQETAKYKTTLAVLACCVFFLIQNIPVLALHPYYGTYYNQCWRMTDITKLITIGEASGLDIAAHYLNDKPDSADFLVQVSPLATEFVRHYLLGFGYRADSGIGNVADYEVVYIRDSQIGRVPETGTLNGDLETIITLNGIDHVWIYRIRRKNTP